MALEDTTDMTPAAPDRGDDFTPTPEAVAQAAAAAAVADALPASKSESTLDDDADLDLAKGGKTELEPTRDEKGRFIPKGRFDEAVGKEREAREAAERKVAELQAQMAQVNKNADTAVLEEEIQELERKHSRLALDGDHEGAAKLMTQIRLKERSIALSQAENLSAQARAQAAEEVRMDMAISTLESTYDIMNPQHEAYDQDIVDLVLGQQRQFIENDRMAPSAALAKAATKVMSKLIPPPAKEEPPAKKGLSAADGGVQRAQAQVAKNIAVAKGQPASTRDVGLDSDQAGATAVVEASKLSYEEFNALPAATKARMRGDMI